MRDARDGLASIIQNRGYKQRAIAQRAGLSDQVFSAILNKKRKMDANEMFRICLAMGISPDELYEDECETTEEGGPDG